MKETMQTELLQKAMQAREHSYSPYSHYAVGAALLCMDGTIYEGCNIENAAYGPTICAERTAFFKAVSEGKRRFAAIAVVGSGEEPAYPCGICRQVMAEFCSKEFVILSANQTADRVDVQTLDQLLPHAFGAENLQNKEGL